MTLLNALPTSIISEIVEQLHPRLYIDFFRHLPPEICVKILNYLDPVSLVNVIKTCRRWCNLALDLRLWERLYYMEGWKAFPAEIKASEDKINEGLNETIGHLNNLILPEDRPTKIRALLNDDDEDVIMSEPGRSMSTGDTGSQSIFGGPMGQTSDTATSGSSASIRSVRSSAAKTRRRAAHGPPTLQPADPGALRQSTLWAWDSKARRYVINWKYLYTMRMRLETNWELGKSTPFQLPHPSYPEEGHSECVYALQYDINWLVSGSRDRTLRIWNLHTQRLARPPLVGHRGSILCLQFDADPAEDLLVSGSSDSDVIVWKFSTGEMIQRLSRAHSESVLNVKFDKRILVTSSKDKTIRIFNRRALQYGDVGYGNEGALQAVPRVIKDYEPDLARELPAKPPFSIIGKLDGHNAAVNSIQVRGETVVSVSGDRHVKIWNWPKQACIKTIPAHKKGIACVEYDERRIVSGSSDFEVCIFDAPTGLKVATLRGHSDLVRTVQAGFADLPYSQHEDEAEAKRVDAEFFKAVEAGIIEPEGERGHRRNRTGNAGSSRPADVQSFGAKLPPGGGGGRRWARIISGSYDHSILLWRRDKEGVWKPAHHLRQEEAAAEVQRRDRDGMYPSPGLTPAGTPQPSLSPAHYFVQQGPLPLPNVHDSNPATSSAVYMALIDELIPAGPAALEQALVTYPGLLAHGHYLYTAIRRQVAPHMRDAFEQALMAAGVSNGQSNTGATAGTSSLARSSSLMTDPNAGLGIDLANVGGPAQTPAGRGQSSGSRPTPSRHADLPPHPHIASAAPPLEHLPARIFKLQYDARKIVCVSQAPVIVGWDFCNEDVELVEASRFFAKID